MSKVWCTTWVCNSTKNETLARIYKGKNKAPSFGPTWKFKDQYHFCFCVDDKFKCIMGNKWPHDLDIVYTFSMACFEGNKSNPRGGASPWGCKVLIGSSKNDLMPCWLFGGFEIGLASPLGPPLDAHVHLRCWYGKDVHWFQLGINHNNKWSIIVCMNVFMKLPLALISPPRYGMVFSLE